MKSWYFIILVITIASCKNNLESDRTKFLTEKIPSEIPIVFQEHLTPKDKIIHKGIFSADFQQYYYTLSNKDFTQFDIYVIEKVKGTWSAPKKAFFNSAFDDHGMSFSPDGNTLYFSSTRPANIDSIPKTWHIWKSEKVKGKWTIPSYVDIPNLRDKLMSHPVMTNNGNLYFHASNLDYSEMDIYCAKKANGRFSDAKKIDISIKTDKCTPFVSSDEEFIIFATIGNQLDLMISFNDGNGKWLNTRKLNDTINTSGQGNPFVTPDGKFLFYTVAEQQNQQWSIKWVNISSELTLE